MTWADARQDAERLLAALPPIASTRGALVALAWYESQADLDLMQPENTWSVRHHQMVTRAAQRTLLKSGTKVRLVTLTAAAYLAWLRDRTNTPDLRAEYLTTQLRAGVPHDEI